MPIHLSAHSRRRFLKIVGAGLLVSSSRGFAAEDQSIERDLVYLLNDTHIGEKHPPDSAVPTHLRMAVSELTARKSKPACVLINGDLALKDGQPGDYRHFTKLIQPLRDAKIDTHLTLGNHDNREAFYEVLKEERRTNAPIASRHISIVQTEFANFFLLDSLQETMVTQGKIGSDQLRWLTQSLDAHPAKPAIIVTHHNPRLGGDPRHYPGGLIDSRELWNVLAKRTQVKAYVHGHVHDRKYAEHEGIHILNTLATSYVADPNKSTTGWTTARLTADDVTLTTRTTDPKHQWNGQIRKLKWRTT